MCKIMEDYGDKRAEERAKKERIQIALKLIEKGYPFEEIADSTELPIETIKVLAENQSA